MFTYRVYFYPNVFSLTFFVQRTVFTFIVPCLPTVFTFVVPCLQKHPNVFRDTLSMNRTVSMSHFQPEIVLEDRNNSNKDMRFPRAVSYY